jgi:NAD(P)-dependent dehydrogenase (short-subunit alcohol dehydrogenase family)
LAAFGAVHLLCNNAGVWAGVSAWDSSLADWEWVLGVNLWGVIHGLHTFVPLMLAQGTAGHIVNTASMAGLLTGRGPAVYRVSKHAVVALSEMLYHQLVQRGAHVKASVRLLTALARAQSRTLSPQSLDDLCRVVGLGDPA